MFKNLQAKWKVKGWQLALILTTFAIGGSLTGWLGRKLLALAGLDRNLVYYILYILIITMVWPLAVLVVSVPLGQYPFFKKYIRRILGRFRGKSHAEVVEEEEAGNQLAVGQLAVGNERPSVIKVAIFASGAGSNAQKIIDHYRNSSNVSVALIVCNKPEAGVLAIAKKEGIPTLLIDKEPFFRGNAYVDELKAAGIQFIVLAGFLWKIPAALINAYPQKMINIHPALLPKYGGKGMYGRHVHEAVLAAGEIESGITIHYVDEQYDHGNTIFQATCPVYPSDTPEGLAKRVHELEHEHFPMVVEKCLQLL